MLGLYVSDHPLFGVEHVLASQTDCSVAELMADEERPDGTQVTVGGLITNLQRKVTRKGDAYAIAAVEDLEGAIEVVFIPQTYQVVAPHLHEDRIVLVKGRLNRREEAPKLLAMELSLPDIETSEARGPVVITLPASRCVPPVVDRLKEVLGAHPGTVEVHLQLQAGGRTTVMRLDDGLRVQPSPALYGDVKALLGQGSLASATGAGVGQ